MPTRDRGFGDGHDAPLADGSFLDVRGVGPFRHHPTGEDPDSLTRVNRFVEWAACRDLADYLELCASPGGIGGAYCITVHRRHRLRRLGAQGRDVAREHPMIGG